jgi:hypothetical protein
MWGPSDLYLFVGSVSGINEGFGLDGVGEAEAALNAEVEFMKKNKAKTVEPINVTSLNLVCVNELDNDEIGEHDIEDGYSSEELDSASEDSDVDGLQ